MCINLQPAIPDSVEAGAIIPSKRKERDSSDDVPLISLDERLREITGEAPESTSPVESPKPMEEALDSSQVGSVFAIFLVNC